MNMPYKEIIDLGHEFYSGMATISGAQVAFWPTQSFKKSETITGGKLSMESRMMLLQEHSGTHLDVPRHCVPNGTDVADVPLEKLVLPGHLLDLTAKAKGEAITIADLERAEEISGRKIGGGTAVLVWTDVDEDWGKLGSTPSAPTCPWPRRRGW